MNKFLIVIAFIISSLNQINAQKYVATFSDGESVEYEILTTNSDDRNHLDISFNAFYGDVFTGISASYVAPKVCYTRATYSKCNYGIESLVFIGSKVKTKPSSYTVKSEDTGVNTITNYKASTDLTIKTNYGIHVGITYKDYGGDINFIRENTNMYEVALGVGRIKSKHIAIVLQGKKKPVKLSGSSQGGLFADFLYYPVINYVTEPYEEANGDELFTKYGFRVYFDGKTSFWGKGDYGLTYRLGYGMSPYKYQKHYLMIGLGFYIGFGFLN